MAQQAWWVQSFNKATGRYAPQLKTGKSPFIMKVANMKRV